MTESFPRQRLCRLDDLTDPGSRSFTLRMHDGAVEEVFVVRRGNRVFAYVNHCPHTGSPLDWQPGQFLNLERTLIQCATHFALFKIEDGHCISGPCAGQTLTPVAVELVDDWVEVVAREIL
ncbi:MAG: Rieske (2Fe-2S) protein [Gammaproteobacteria bacterium]|nr:Rieske (2Fe-2S) protein [Gammaproteobacteria bacterium]MBU2477751.1 Rieske (2Fe-2S) protein [Gammaproteobacteria bacterium]